MYELERNSDYSREGWEWLFPRLSSWSEALSPRAGVCLLPVAWGRDGPGRLAASSDPPQHRLPSAWWEDRFSQAQSRAVWSWHLPCGNSKPLSTALSFSLQPENWGGSQLGGSHIEKLGGAWGTLRPWSGIQTQVPPWEFYIMQRWPEKGSFVEIVPSHPAMAGLATVTDVGWETWLAVYQGLPLAKLGPSPFQGPQVVSGGDWTSMRILM